MRTRRLRRGQPAARAELHEAIEEGFRDFENGEYEDGLAFAARLAATK